MAQTVPIQAQGSTKKTFTQTIALAKTQLHYIFNLFDMYQPKKFNSANDSVVTEEWLESIENVMALFEMTNQERIRYVTYFFKSNIKAWWNLFLETTKISEMSWSKFKKRFKVEYKGTNMTCIKAQKFIVLT